MAEQKSEDILFIIPVTLYLKGKGFCFFAKTIATEYICNNPLQIGRVERSSRSLAPEKSRDAFNCIHLNINTLMLRFKYCYY